MSCFLSEWSSSGIIHSIIIAALKSILRRWRCFPSPTRLDECEASWFKVKRLRTTKQSSEEWVGAGSNKTLDTSARRTVLSERDRRIESEHGQHQTVRAEEIMDAVRKPPGKCYETEYLRRIVKRLDLFFYVSLKTTSYH